MLNPSAAKETTNEFYKSAYNFFQYFTGDDEKSSDLTVMAFRRIRYREKQMTQNDMFRVVYMIALEVDSRENTPKTLRMRRLQELSSMPSIMPRSMRQRILKLSFMERVLILFHDMLGISIVDISSFTRLPASVVRKRVHEARINLLARSAGDAGHA